MLDGIICALTKNSIYLLRMLVRAIFEQQMHLQIILKPLMELHGVQNSRKQVHVPEKLAKDEEDRTINRLTGCAAWCIWHDRLNCKQVLEHETLDAIWDHSPAFQIIDDLVKFKAYEAIFGKLNVKTSVRELKKGRLKQQDAGYHKICRLEAWLNHADLMPWHQRMMSLSKGRLERSVNLFSLLDEIKPGVKSGLNDLELPFAYPLYTEGSMTIHGSTLDQFMHLGDNAVTPLFLGMPDEVNSVALELGQMCNQIVVGLFLLKFRVWGM